MNTIASGVVVHEDTPELTTHIRKHVREQVIRVRGLEADGTNSNFDSILSTPRRTSKKGPRQDRPAITKITCPTQGNVPFRRQTRKRPRHGTDTERDWTVQVLSNIRASTAEINEK